MGSSNRRWLNRPAHSSVTRSTASRLCHDRRWTTSALYSRGRGRQNITPPESPANGPGSTEILNRHPSRGGQLSSHPEPPASSASRYTANLTHSPLRQPRNHPSTCGIALIRYATQIPASTLKISSRNISIRNQPPFF